MKIALCMLTLNELPGCQHDIPLIKRVRKSLVQIFGVDNGSKDGTIEYLRKQKITVYSRPGITYSAMHVLAVEKCKADAIIFFHPKATIPVKDILKYKKYFEKGYEFIVASRVMKNSRNEEDNKFIKPRKWLTLILAAIISLRWKKSGNTVWDVLHGFRGMTIPAFKKINFSKTGLLIDIEGVIGAYRHDLKRIEFPTKEKPRSYGETHFKLISFGSKVIKYLLKEFIKN